MLASEPNTLNTVIRSSGPVRYVSKSMVESLVAQDPDGNPTLGGIVTGIAAKVGSAGAYRIQLRPDIKFHDGETLTGEDVAFSINTVLDHSSTKSYWSDLTGAKPSGDSAVDVTVGGTLTKEDVLSRLSGIDALPKAYYEKVGAEKFGTSPVGTGPFKFVDWQAGLSITAERFGDYWGGRPGPSRVEFTFSADGATRKVQVESGEADLTSGVTPQLLQSVGDEARVQFAPSHSALMWQFTNEGLTSDVRIRKAIALALDPEPIIDQFLDGHGDAAFWVIPPEFTGLDLERARDVETARTLVDEVRAEVGELPPLELSYWSGRYPADAEIGSATAAQIEDIGLKVKEVPLPDPQYLPKMVNGELKGLHMTSYGMEFPTPDRALQSYTLRTSLQGYCNFLDVDGLYKKAKTATAAERADYYAQIERTDLEKTVCNIPIVKSEESYLIAKRVEGFVPHYDGTFNLADFKIN
ncbi:ABC transporter substrate-binding protein [Frankia sp. Cpl3]|nr:ABC transporter substrate-binding protein [Frankia sp. Cpl3]